MLTDRQAAFAIVGAVVLIAIVLKLIYDRRLREDYGALWFAVSAFVLVLSVWQEGLRLIARALDALTLTAPIFLVSILFLTLIAIHFSVQLTRVSRRLSRLAQRIALLEATEQAPGTDDGMGSSNDRG